MDKNRQQLLSIGKIINFHGVKGEVKAGFTEGNENILSSIKHVFIIKGAETLKLDIDNVRFHKKFAIIKFKQVNSVDEAVKIKGNLLKLPKKELEKYLEEDEFYVSDLVGLKVYDNNGGYIGEISAVANLREQDVLFIKNTENRENIVPFKKEFVPEVNLEEGWILVNIIEGLLEENEI